MFWRSALVYPETYFNRVEDYDSDYNNEDNDSCSDEDKNNKNINKYKYKDLDGSPNNSIRRNNRINEMGRFNKNDFNYKKHCLNLLHKYLMDPTMTIVNILDFIQTLSFRQISESEYATYEYDTYCDNGEYKFIVRTCFIHNGVFCNELKEQIMIRCVGNIISCCKKSGLDKINDLNISRLENWFLINI